jgi:NADPH:quinone reductase-like Zn-dependent oxidoreductase
MRAMVPDGAGSVIEADVPEPLPGADQVLVRVEAFSINRGETFLLDQPAPGWRPGKDVAGTVVVGDGTVRAGQRVVAHPEHSGWAERVVVPSNCLAMLPDDVDVRTAAALPLAGLTALRLLRVIGALPSRNILLTGASGGVGHYFVELAAAAGARVTAFTSTAARGERLRDLGAQRVVTNLDDAAGPFDVVVESVGGEVFPAAWRRLHPRGLFVWMGQASRRAPMFDFFDWTGGHSATLRKFLYSDSDIDDGADLATLVRLVAAGRLHPEIGLHAPWSDTRDALAALVARRVRGNAVLEVTP